MILFTNDWVLNTRYERSDIDLHTTNLVPIRENVQSIVEINFNYGGFDFHLETTQVYVRTANLLRTLPPHVIYLQIYSFKNETLSFDNPPTALQMIAIIDSIPNTVTHLSVSPQFMCMIYHVGCKLPSDEERDVYYNLIQRLFKFKSIKIHSEGDMLELNTLRYKEWLGFCDILLKNNQVISLYEELPLSLNILPEHSLVKIAQDIHLAYKADQIKPEIQIIQEKKSLFFNVYMWISSPFRYVYHRIKNYFALQNPQVECKTKQFIPKLQIDLVSEELLLKLVKIDPAYITKITKECYKSIDNYIAATPMILSNSLYSKIDGLRLLCSLLQLTLDRKLNMPELCIDLILNMSEPVNCMLLNNFTVKQINEFIIELQSAKSLELINKHGIQGKVIDFIYDMLHYICNYESKFNELTSDKETMVKIIASINWLRDQEVWPQDKEFDILFCANLELLEQLAGIAKTRTASITDASINHSPNMIFSTSPPMQEIASQDEEEIIPTKKYSDTGVDTDFYAAAPAPC